MKFVIITNVNHVQKGDQYFGYAPYVHEMNIWFHNVDEAIIVAPLAKGFPTAIDLAYQCSKIDFKEVPAFSLTSVRAVFKTILQLPVLFWTIYKSMREADHIHLRCPGNMGLLGCMIQILFPLKKKTTKYAGNWDPKSKQPFSYRLQKWILSNIFLTRNMQVLVYGEWENQTKNIKPFFTATYHDKEKLPVKELNFKGMINFVFVGTLSLGKNPLYAIRLIEKLCAKGHKVSLDLYGEGEERKTLEDYIESNRLVKNIVLKGNQDKETIKKAYQNSHFVILPSKSEGWPKAIAEGMFWGCVPIATNVSCVSFMLDFGKRGVLLEMNFDKDVAQIENLFLDPKDFFDKSSLSRIWSQQYTTDVFETEIRKMINHEAYRKDKNI